MLGTLLMVAVAISMAILAYVWSIGLTGTLMGGGGSQVREQLILESYRWDVGGQLTLNLRNVGTTAVTVAALYVGGTLQTSSGFENQPINVGTSFSGAWPPAGSFSAGVAYVLKVVTQTGSVTTSALIYGGAG